jgi:hypothetical protein
LRPTKRKYIAGENIPHHRHDLTPPPKPAPKPTITKLPHHINHQKKEDAKKNKKRNPFHFALRL